MKKPAEAGYVNLSDYYHQRMAVIKGVITNAATPIATRRIASPAQKRSHGDELIVIISPSLGWIFISTLLKSSTSSSLVVQG